VIGPGEASQVSDSAHIQFFGPGETPQEGLGLEVLGGKGINLVELTSAGFPVPPGFVVTTRAYRDFVAANDLQERIEAILEKSGVTDPRRLEEASAEIRALFKVSHIPEGLAAEIGVAYGKLKAKGQESVAVRSSATAEDLPEASFAGQQDTYLNIRGEQALLEAVKSCWGSLWTARAISYREQQKIGRVGLALAVVIQQMVLAESAGVMFTANPVTYASDEIVINAAWGLGEAVVGGEVTPDTMVVEKETGKVKDVQVSEKTVMTSLTAEGTEETELTDDRRNARVLDDEQAGALALVGRKVEEHYGSPQDIEWCMLAGETYLVQARPITNLPDVMITSGDIDAARREGIDLIRGEVERLGRRTRYAVYNLAETLDRPTPMTWDIMNRFMSGSGGFINMYRDFGYFPSERVNREGILRLIGGRIYADLELHAELFFDQWPQEYDPEEAEDATTMLEGPPTKFNFERSGGAFLLRLPLYIVKMIRQSRRLKKLARTYLEKFEGEVRPRFEAYVRSAREKNLAEMNDSQLLAELDEREKAFNQIARESEKTSFIAGYYQGSLTGVLEDLLGVKEGQAFCNRLISGLDGNKTEEQNVALHAVAQGEMSLDKFMAEYGHRAAGEFELAEPRWYEDSSYLEQQLETYRMAHGGRTLEPGTAHQRSKADRAEAEKELTALLDEHGAASLEEDIRADMLGAQKYMPYRETSKHYYMMAYALIRDALQALAKHWDLGGDIYFLHRSELADFTSRREELLEVIRKRKINWRAVHHLEMPDFLDSEDPEAVGRPIEIEVSGDGVFGGKGVAPGSDTGTARIVFSPKEAGEMGADYVLVCPSTDPGWTPLFVHARGVIVERGGMLSHGAIVARDFGIPCVVLPNATRIIPDKTEIKIDGSRGVVEIVATEPAVKEV